MVGLKAIKNFWVSILILVPAYLNAQLTVISYNIRYDNWGDSLNAWSFRKQALASFLLQKNPDILGFQEVLNNQLLDLDSLLNQSENSSSVYAWIGVGREDGLNAGEYCPIFFNRKKYKVLAWETRWLSPTPTVPSKGWDAALPRVATIGKFQELKTRREFVVINTHFDHLGEQARFNSAKALIAWVDTLLSEGTPVLLLGDFNADRNSKSIRWIFTSYKLNSAITSPAMAPKGTFNGFKDTVGPEIDYIFYSSHFHKLSSQIDYTQRGSGLYLSDHFPVISVFENAIPRFNVGICYPGAWAVQKIRLQAEYILNEKQSLSANITRLNVLWQTQTLGLEYRYYPTVRRKSKLGYYGFLSSGFGKADHYGNGSFAALGGGFVQQSFMGKSNRWFFEFQVGARAGTMMTGDLESGGGFGGLLYIAGPLSVVDFRVNMGYRF